MESNIFFNSRRLHEIALAIARKGRMGQSSFIHLFIYVLRQDILQPVCRLYDNEGEGAGREVEGAQGGFLPS